MTSFKTTALAGASIVLLSTAAMGAGHIDKDALADAVRADLASKYDLSRFDEIRVRIRGNRIIVEAEGDDIEVTNRYGIDDGGLTLVRSRVDEDDDKSDDDESDDDESDDDESSDDDEDDESDESDDEDDDDESDESDDEDDDDGDDESDDESDDSDDDDDDDDDGGDDGEDDDE